MTVAFDHVLLTAPDPDAAGDELFAATGLASIAGGEHVGQGTRNRIVPLGDGYLEHLGLVAGDPVTSVMSDWVRGRPAGPAALCLRTDRIDEDAARLGTTAFAMERRRPDGVVLRWRLAGLEMAIEHGSPFYIEWDVAAGDHPQAAHADHRVQPTGIAWVELGGAEARIAASLGEHDLDVRLVGGSPGVRRVAVATDAGEIIIG